MIGQSQSLSRRDAIARRELLEVTGYDVQLDLTPSDGTFASITSVGFTSTGGPTFVDLKPVRVRSITLNGRPLDPEMLVRGRLPIETAPGENILVVDADMPFRNDGEGLHRSIDPADGKQYVYGMSFMDAAPSIFACFDQPDLKASYTFHVRAPHDWVVIGNAPAENPEPGRWELGTTQPLSTYFVTLVAGPYHLIRDEHDGIPLGLSARASIARHLDADADELLTLTRQCFDEFHRLFGIRYPFGDYHQAFVPEFNAGAMENPGCVTFRDPLVFTTRVNRGMRITRATTLAHEMAHQWFGNIVTPRWWDDLWLNESFAEYMGNRVTADVTEYADAWVDNAYARRQWGLVADQRPSTHPVAGNGADDALSALQDFDGISYAKGSSILRQINANLGDTVFFDGVIDHLERHRFGNATMHDLFASWERSGAKDLTDVTSQWLRTAGPDAIVLDRDAGVIRRTPPPAHPADRTHTFRVALHGEGGWRTDTVTLAADETAYDAGDAPVLLDPFEDSWTAGRPDPVTWDALPTLLPTMTDPLLRAGAWNSVRTAFHNAEVSPQVVVDLLEASLPVEDSEDGPRRTMGWVQTQVLPLAPPGSVDRLHRAAVHKLSVVPAGSELQLAAFRIAVSCATDSGRLRGWLAGDDLATGLELDSGLRWRILVSLARLGAADAEELDAALAAEPTAETTVAHTLARASLPTAEAKAYAWDRFTGRVDVPNYELAAAGRGMWRAGQEDLLAAYVDRFFDDLPGTAAVRSGWVLADCAEHFFPRVAVGADTLARTRALIDDESLDRSLRRRLVDQADDLQRHLTIAATWPHP